ncbi:hypothetical protein M899_0588 [Bacteriovorax sp. BSW11_IV]|uniref:hypothetical protein n=1 Tax=Bacteriovorax sp. BSW11_IV TaxID=1353529 RepID=UPI000389E1BD|nr:hypothetical protein [Bacteriovorax sp. BSW11_IV]EQC45040.1 hypothetical protein M899_0588 [Bacteriovorax sp. BSW11_IV]
MKRAAIIFSTIFILAGIVYFFYANQSLNSTSPDTISKKVESSFDKNDDSVKSPSLLTKEDVKAISESTSLTEEQIIELEATFEEIETHWQEEVQDIFINDMGLTKEHVEDYFKMREGFEKDSYEAFEAFHEEMVRKHGENYSYNPTEDEEAFQKKIRERYETEFQKKIGLENFQKYIQLKDSFNQRLIEKYDSNKGVLHIEF